MRNYRAIRKPRFLYWSATRIDTANYCRMRYYLRYVEKEKPIYLSVYAKGKLLHELVENFWKNLGTEEEVKKKRKKYFDAESFADYGRRQWVYKTILSDKSKRSERKIVWRFDDEKWVMRSDISNICYKLYEYLSSKPKPLFSELEFKFHLGGLNFLGYIDEVYMENGKPVIRDYKSGNPYLGTMKIDHDPQLTFYNAGLCAKCFEDEKFARLLGLSDICHTFMGNPHYVCADIREEFFMLETLGKIKKNEDLKKDGKIPEKEPPPLIHTTSRTDEHFLELVNMIRMTEKSVINGDVYPERGRKCDACDMNIACAKRLECVRREVLVDSKGNLMFDFKTRPYENPPLPEPQQINTPKKQKKFDYRKREVWK